MLFSWKIGICFSFLGSFLSLLFLSFYIEKTWKLEVLTQIYHFFPVWQRHHCSLVLIQGKMKVGVEFVLDTWNFSFSPPSTSKICMGFGKQIRNWIFHKYLKNAFLNDTELWLLNSAVSFRGLGCKVVGKSLFLLSFDFLKNESLLKVNIKNPLC